MDNKIQNIKMSVWLVSSPDRHTVHKTMRAPFYWHCKPLDRIYKPPPEQYRALCGLLNVNLMAVDFTSIRETGRPFFFIDNAFLNSLFAEWQCFIAKYP